MMSSEHKVHTHIIVKYQDVCQSGARGRKRVGEKSRGKGQELSLGSFKDNEGESREDPSKLTRYPDYYTETWTGGRSTWSGGGKETRRVSDKGYENWDLRQWPMDR